MKVASRLSFVNPFGGFLNKTSLADLHINSTKINHNIITGISGPRYITPRRSSEVMKKIFLNSFSRRFNPQFTVVENYNLRTKLTRIDMIDDKTIAFYGSGGSGDPSVGGFTWSGHFTWESLPEQVTGPPTWSRLSLNFFYCWSRGCSSGAVLSPDLGICV